VDFAEILAAVTPAPRHEGGRSRAPENFRIKRSTLLALAAILTFEPNVALAERQLAASDIPECRTRALGLKVNDDSPGMGREGVLLTVRSVAFYACRLAESPRIALVSAKGRVVAWGTAPPATVVLLPGYAAYGTVVWSDGIGGNRPCADATKISLNPGAGGITLAKPTIAHLCALRTKTPSITTTAFSLKKPEGTGW
jgi:hypothetical protein